MYSTKFHECRGLKYLTFRLKHAEQCTSRCPIKLEVKLELDGSCSLCTSCMPQCWDQCWDSGFGHWGLRVLSEQSSCLLCMPDSVSKKVKYGALKYKTFWINSLVTTLCSYKKMLGKCVQIWKIFFHTHIWKPRRRPLHFKLSSFLMLTQPYL